MTPVAASSEDNTAGIGSCALFWALALVCVAMLLWMPQIPTDKLRLSIVYAANWAAFVLLFGIIVYHIYADGDLLSIDVIYAGAFIFSIFGMVLALVIAGHGSILFSSSAMMKVNGNFTAQAVWFSFVCLGLFVAGYNSIPAKYRSPKEKMGKVLPEDHARVQLWYYTGVSLTVCSAVVFFYGVVKLGGLSYLDKPYIQSGLGYTNPSIDARFVAKGGDVFGLALVMTFVSWCIRAKGSLPKWYIALAIAILIVIAMAGDRSMLFAIGFPLLIVYHYLRRPLSARSIALLIVAVAFAFAFLKHFRAVETKLSLGREQLTEVAAQTSGTKLLYEVGIRLPWISRSLALFPDSYPFRGGKTYLYFMRTVIPNIGPTQRPTSRSDPNLDDDKLPMSTFLVKHTFPIAYEFGSGLGYIAVGEAYVNFGWPGALLFFAVGLFVRAFFEKARMHASVGWWSIFCLVLTTWFLMLLCDAGALGDLTQMIAIVVICWVFIEALLRLQQFASAREVWATQMHGQGE